MQKRHNGQNTKRNNTNKQIQKKENAMTKSEEKYENKKPKKQTRAKQSEAIRNKVNKSTNINK